MNRMFSIASVLALSLAGLFSVSAGVSILYGQQNQTSNMTSTQQQQNQTGIGSASGIEKMTAGNIPVLGNATDIESQSQNDTSLAQGLQREKMTTDTDMTTNQTEGGMTNGTTANQTGAEGEQQQGNQTEKGPLEQLGETISGMFGGGNQSN
jgi:hypothetical protein